MTFSDFLDFIMLVETKVNLCDSLDDNKHNESQQALMLRCQQDKKLAINQLGALSGIETFPHLCLTVAIGSYLLQLDQVFFLNLPKELQDWLFLQYLLWIQGSPEQRDNIDRYLVEQTSDWQQWISKKPKDWSPALHQKLEREVSSAREQIQKSRNF